MTGGMNAMLRANKASGQERLSPSIRTCTLGFSTYGMPSLRSETAIDVLAKIGFDSVELAVREGWDADSAELSEARKKAIRVRLEEHSLRLTSLMEHVSPLSDKQQAFALERLKLATELAHELAPSTPPLVQTVLGGGDFESSKNLLRDRLGRWVRLADETQTAIAIKPHRGGVVSQPAEAVWLFEQLGAPDRLRMVFDYSHYAFRDLPLIETIETSLPYVAHVAVKDVKRVDDRVVFELPGETRNIDFADLISRLHGGGYRGDINCEVSSMVSKRAGYDAVAAARTCYRNLSTAFERSGVERPS
ncbi:Xylose isomerase-like TIM barrel [Neorhodopirellula pilleata]|uniref:Xylose isomerase-like TIM barrel n=2 Tax=Neorhodopirellula pilleata TaxID=2714738 RepID=A0A5C6AUI9_9BACT|nr:Xylose isomerase-like TIM barrel [Neorhodopirellula pilleata]